MKRITLQQLILQNFKGMTFKLFAGGADTNISGANATGKTTLADAFSWLLFDKDSLGRADFEIKNLDSKGEAVHGVDHSVEGVLDVDDTTVTLKKVYREIWTKKRGSAQATFTGHTTEYFIDGVPVQKKEYTTRVADIAGDEAVFRLLTSPTVFPALHWQKQRALLLEVCGDISDADVIASDAGLARLSEILGKRTLDDHRKVIAVRRSEINKELEKIPVRIDEVRRGLPDIAGKNRKAIEADIVRLESSLNDAKLKLQGIDTGGTVADLSKKLAGINADLQRLESTHYSETMKAANRIGQQITEIDENLRQSARRISALQGELLATEKRVAAIEPELQNLRAKWITIDAEEFKDTTEDTCAACGQTLPSDRVQSAREKALAAFNVRKAERLEEIARKGMALKEEKEALESKIESIKAELSTVAHSDYSAMEQQKQTLTEERDALKKTAEDYLLIPNHGLLTLEKADLEVQIKAEREGKAADTEKIKGEIFNLEHLLVAAKADADSFTRREQGEKRIEELMATEKQLAAEYEKLEQELYLTEQFVRTKVQLLTERINSRFEVARFKLFDVQVNGGLAECCEITVNGIPYNGGLNNAARINAGLDVCRTLASHYGLQVPVFVDNAESVSQLVDMNSQVIRLVVSEQDATLRVETARMRERVAA